MFLELEKKWHLIDSLLKCPTFQNDKNRRLFMKQLPFSDVIEEHEQPKMQVLNIVDTCMNHNDGFKLMFETLRYFENETIPFKTALQEFINLASETAKLLERNQAYTDAIQQWQTIQVLAPDAPQVSQTIQRLEAKIAQTPRVVDLQKRLSKRQLDIESVYLDVARYLNRLERQGMGVDHDIEMIKNITNFLDDNLTASEFMALWAKRSEIPRPTKNIPNYQFLADGLQSGDIAIFLGTDLPLVCTSHLPNEEEIVSKLVDDVQYPELSVSFAQICEYMKLNREVPRTRLPRKLKELVEPSDLVPIKLYQLLASIETPLLLISTQYDTLLERTFQQKQKKFVVLSNDFKAPGRFRLQYSDNHNEPKKPCYLDEHDFSPLEDDYSIIFKILGSFGMNAFSQESFITAESDFFKFTQDKLLPEYIALKLQEQTLCLLGHNPQTWEKRLVIREILETTRQPLAILHNISEFVRVYLEAQNIKHYQIGLNEFIENLHRHISHATL